MPNRTPLTQPLPEAKSCALHARLIPAATSRRGRKPAREAGGGAAAGRRAWVVCLCALLVLCGARVGLAKGRDKAASPRAANAKAAKLKAAKLMDERLSAQYLLDKDVDEIDGRRMRRKLRLLLVRQGVRDFLAVVRKAEGGEPNLMVGGCRAKSLKYHPAVTLPKSCWFRGRVSYWKFSTAAGSFQLTFSNWRRLAPFLELPDFSETSQALAALELIRRGGGAAGATTPRGLAIKRRIQKGFLQLLKGDVESALCLASYDWASSSCSPLPANAKLAYAEMAAAMRRSRAQTLTAGTATRRRDAPPRVRAR